MKPKTTTTLRSTGAGTALPMRAPASAPRIEPTAMNRPRPSAPGVVAMKKSAATTLTSAWSQFSVALWTRMSALRKMPRTPSRMTPWAAEK